MNKKMNIKGGIKQLEKFSDERRIGGGPDIAKDIGLFKLDAVGIQNHDFLKVSFSGEMKLVGDLGDESANSLRKDERNEKLLGDLFHGNARVGISVVNDHGRFRVISGVSGSTCARHNGAGKIGFLQFVRRRSPRDNGCVGGKTEHFGVVSFFVESRSDADDGAGMELRCFVQRNKQLAIPKLETSVR